MTSPLIHPFKPRRGFTLVELIVSIAIVVVLMIGVAQVFQYTGQAVGASQQMSDAVRNDRAMQSTMTADIQQIAQDSPVLMIRNAAGMMFRNRADLAADPDGNALTWEQRATDTGAVSTSFAASPNERSHRVDRLAFMSRGKFPRQTGDDGTFVAPMTASEAFVWYGHLCLPHTSGTFYLGGATSGTKTNPGAGTFGVNPQNYFSTQWTLGRVGHLLIEPAGVTTANPGTIALGAGTTNFIYRTPGDPLNPVPDPPLVNLTPFSDGANATGTGSFQSVDCRYDLAGTSIKGFANILRRVLGTEWKEGLNYVVGQRVSHRGYSYTAAQNHTSNAANAPNPFTVPPQWTADSINISDWWTDMFMTTRYECNPFAIKPLDSKNYSQQAPVFAPGCTQFIVEYAGDFLRQDTDPSSPTYGYVLDTFDNPVPPPGGYQHTDGQTDFIVTWTDADGDGLIDANETASVKREVRWYGLPRDVNGDGIVQGYNDATGTRPQFLNDVVPFRDVAMTIHTIANLGTAPFNTLPYSSNAATFYDPSNLPFSYIGAPFERFLFQGGGPPELPIRPYYMNVSTDPGNTTGMQPNEVYQCVWGPYDTVRPKMIRITITLDDPNSRFAEGQTFQYVFKLP